MTSGIKSCAKKVCFVFFMVFFISLLIPACVKRVPTAPGIYRDWNDEINQLEIFQTFKISDYSKIVVVPFDTSTVQLPPIKDNTYEPVKRVLLSINDILIEGMQKVFKDKMNIGLLEKDYENNPEISKVGVLIIKGKVIELNPGSLALRQWVGFTGAGRARIEIEGEILDAKTNTTLLKFKHDQYNLSKWVSYEIIMRWIVHEVGENISSMLLHF